MGVVRVPEREGVLLITTLNLTAESHKLISLIRVPYPDKSCEKWFACRFDSDKLACEFNETEKRIII
jgi:hypothetical protein